METGTSVVLENEIKRRREKGGGGGGGTFRKLIKA
jgi:hypothetical protein